ncbi:hypothetical protein [Ligilactobacillus animalis]|uniref:hypothetical protein n=1 Tax=Ligilactobacillus animalis TaxID=1605 RepID=UPI003AEF3F53
MQYVKLDDLESVLKSIKRARDKDLLNNPEHLIIWKWVVNNFEHKISEGEKELKDGNDVLKKLEDKIKKEVSKDTSEG